MRRVGTGSFTEILDAMLAAEPWATESRKLDIEREAAKACRRSPAYTDMTAGHAKSHLGLPCGVAGEGPAGSYAG